MTPILFPCNTSWSYEKHLSGQAACPGRTGEDILSEGEFILEKVPFLLPLCSKDKNVGIAVPSLPHTGLWGAQCCVGVRAREKPPVCSQVPNHPHHPATLATVLNHPKKEKRILVCLLLLRGKIWKRQVSPHGRHCQDGLQRIISVSIPSIFNWV